MDEDRYDLDGPTTAAPVAARPAVSRVAPPASGGGSRGHRVKMDAAGAFALGAADTVTFGFVDEIGAGIDSVPYWLGMGGHSYQENLHRNRELLAQAEEEHGTAYTVGQLAGGFVPLAGWGGRIKNMAELTRAGKALEGARAAAKAGLWQGALYGAGSNDGDLVDRLQGAVTGGLFGAGAGLVLGGVVVPVGGFLKDKAVAAFSHGKPLQLLDEFAPNVFKREANAEEAAGLKAAKKAAGPLDPVTNPNAGKVREGEEKVVRNVFTGNAEDVVEEGAILSTKELRGDVNRARNLINERVGKMTAEQALAIAKDLQKNELDGTVLKDPRYRSLLGIDIEDTGVDPETAQRAATLLEEATDAILEKAGLGRKTYEQMEREFEQTFNGQLMENELDDAVGHYAEAVKGARVADHVAMLASVQVSKARSVLLPEVLKGVEGARDRLTESIVQAVSLMTKANFIKSQAGRALNALKMTGKLAFDDVAEHVDELTPEAIRGRVSETLKQLGDTELAEMLSRLRNPRDVDRVLKTLIDPEEAQVVGNFLRVRRSMGAFIKSNLLTPKSAIRNTVGFVLHDLYRNKWARQWAANRYEMSGEADKAMAMRFELAVHNAVYWKAHLAGLKAMVERIKWDHWTTVERRSTLLGQTEKAQGVKQKKMDLLASGFQPAEIREFDLKARAKVMDANAFDQRMKEREAQGGFAAVWAAFQRAGAAGLEQLDAAGTGTAKFVSGALDAWGKNMVTLKETYALSARYAWREAVQLGQQKGLTEEEVIKYANQRTLQLAEMPPGDLLREVEARLANREEVGDDLKFAMGLHQKAQKEGDVSLFLDGPQSKVGRAATQLSSTLVDIGEKHLPGLDLALQITTPYVATPARIMETGLMKYTPWGHKLQEVQKILEGGGPEAALEKARMEMGSMVIGLGVMLGSVGAITVTNGGYKSSSNLNDAPANRINIGGHWVQFEGFDPFGIGVALGGIIGQAVQAYHQADQMGMEQQEVISAAYTTAYLGIRDAVLEKSYLTGLSDMSKALFGNADGDPTMGLQTFAQQKLGTLAATQVPFSGTLRTVSDVVRGNAPEAVGIMDQLLRLVPGGAMPTRRDFLGAPVQHPTGFFMGSTKTGKGDDLRDQLAASGIDLSDVERRDRSGFKLDGEMLDELRHIRATEATNRFGMNLREALTEMMASPEWQHAPTKKAKHEMLKDALDGLNKSAQGILEERNPHYASKRHGYKSLAAYMADGLTSQQAKAAATNDVIAEGLPDPNL